MHVHTIPGTMHPLNFNVGIDGFFALNLPLGPGSCSVSTAVYPPFRTEILAGKLHPFGPSEALCRLV